MFRLSWHNRYEQSLYKLHRVNLPLHFYIFGSDVFGRVANQIRFDDINHRVCLSS